MKMHRPKNLLAPRWPGETLRILALSGKPAATPRPVSGKLINHIVHYNEQLSNFNFDLYYRVNQ
jgi:hypothetical protein